MPTSPPRKFGLFDAMILVAATALGALSLRLFEVHGLELLTLYHGFYPGYEATAYLGIALRFAGPWFAAFSVALLLIRLRGSRRRLARLMRQPGTTACVAATAILALEATLAAIDIAIMGVPPGEDVHFKLLPMCVMAPGAGVLAVWLVQALGRRWRPERSWIDRSGRALGTCWIVVLLVVTWDVFWTVSVDARFRPPGPSPEQLADDESKRLLIDRQLEAHRLELEKETARLQKTLEELNRRNKKASPD